MCVFVCVCMYVCVFVCVCMVCTLCVYSLEIEGDVSNVAVDLRPAT